MKTAHLIVASLLGGVLLVTGAAHAEEQLPTDSDKEQWHKFIDTFAECSAVYNLAATIREFPEQGTATSFRELANNALISGMVSAEKSGLHEDYLESIYSVKLGLWEAAAKDKGQQGALLNKAGECITTTLESQNTIIGKLRKQTAKQ